jgi:prepilin-type N-terminal cleavage/methylation domain-containing protein
MAAFTLIEVLAALLVIAIVVPVAFQGLGLASRAGEVAAYKAAAARVADRVINEIVITTNWNQGTQTGTAMEGGREFRWSTRSELWHVDSMRLITAEVQFSARGQPYAVRLSTLAPQQ